uniref:Variant surface glycoprotein n=1 Tax=Trypanosoma brucei TaxID=5691 RepID=A0A1V0G0A9_9TRYP|nr:variant surface glycoprotein [Trypanosoma brucei]
MTVVRSISAPFASVIVPAILIIQGAKGDAAAELNKQKTPCDSAHYLIKLAAIAEEKLQALADKTAQAAKEQRQIELYAATADKSATGAHFQGLADYASRRVATLAREAAKCRQAVAELTRTLHIEAGRNWVTAEVTKIQSAKGTAVSPSDTNQGTTAKAHLKLNKLQDPTCSSEYTTTAANAEKQPIVTDLENLRRHKLQGKTDATTSNNVCQVECNGATCNTDTTNIQVSSIVADLFSAAELKQLPVKASETKAARTDAPQGLNKELEEHEKNLEHRLYDFLKKKPCDADMASVRNMAVVQNDEGFRKAVLIELQGPEAKYDTSDDSQSKAITNAIKSMFGDSETEFNTKIWDKVKASTVKQKIAGTDIDSKIEQLSTDTNRGLVLAYYASQRKNKPSCKTETSTQKSQQCGSHTTPEPCQKEGCDFDENKTPKCFPKESKDDKKNGDDEKTTTTNTTGSSNSFVIHKAPLWLEF